MWYSLLLSFLVYVSKMKGTYKCKHFNGIIINCILKFTKDPKSVLPWHAFFILFYDTTIKAWTINLMIL